MRMAVGLCMVLINLFLCEQTVSADVAWEPPGLNGDAASVIGLAPWVFLVVIVTVVIIKRMKDKK